MKDNLTELVFIIDRSGSMSGLESDTIGGINAVLKQHKESEGEAFVHTVLFDHEIKVLHDRVDIKEVKPLTNEDYQPRGCTALIDAIGDTIQRVDNIQRYMPEDYKAGHVIFVITTDGLENASKRFTSDQVKKMIEAKKELGWEFLFLGANIDAVEVAGSIGIAEDRTATYISDSCGTGAMYESVACASMSMRHAMPNAAPMDGSWKKSIDEDKRRRGLFGRH